MVALVTNIDSTEYFQVCECFPWLEAAFSVIAPSTPETRKRARKSTVSDLSSKETSSTEDSSKRTKIK